MDALRQFGKYIKNYFTNKKGLIPFDKKVKSEDIKLEIMNAVWRLLDNEIKVEE